MSCTQGSFAAGQALDLSFYVFVYLKYLYKVAEKTYSLTLKSPTLNFYQTPSGHLIIK